MNTSNSTDCRPHLNASSSSDGQRAGVGNPTTNNIVHPKLDALGEFVQLDTNLFLDLGSWTDLFHRIKGRSNFASSLNHLRHQAAPFLQRYAQKGVPVVLTSKPWTLQQKDQAMRRGNHPSTRAFQDFMRTEMADMRSKGMFIVLPYQHVRSFPELRISPLGCVPQRERRPRIINDYTYSGVNGTTLKMAPEEAMQWGRTLHRILWYVHTADRRHGPVLMSKTDLSDGFYQLHLTPSGALKLAVPFSSPSGEMQVAIPTRLPMGWTESPPAFSAVTETIADLVNEKLETGGAIPPIHPLETLASTPVPIAEPEATDHFRVQDTGPLRPPLAYVDVYVDDFVKLAQGWSNALRVRRNTFHIIDQVFRPNDLHDDLRKEPISQKKLLNGDDFWSVQKVILGWLVDSARQTISLPQHRQDRLLAILKKMVKRKRSSVHEWQCLLGELRSMALALPGANGCFSFLQHALGNGNNRIKITKEVRDQLQDFLWLATSVVDRPTHLAEVVPTPPTYFGSVDAAKPGMGGVWFPPLPTPLPFALQQQAHQRLQSPILWRAEFDKKIQDLLVSTDNPSGSITNSDLELAGAIAHDDILVQALRNPTHISSCTFSDNTPAIAWKTKGSTTTTGPAAYLLQTSALHRRHFRYNNELHHISGPTNTMADDCSRLWKMSDSQLVDYFNVNYPQAISWQLHHLRPAMHSALTLNLLKKRSKPEWYLPETRRPHELGGYGWRFAHPLTSTPSYRRWPTLSLSSRPLASAGEMDGSRPVASATELARLRMPSGLSARGFPAWGPKILV